MPPIRPEDEAAADPDRRMVWQCENELVRMIETTCPNERQVIHACGHLRPVWRDFRAGIRLIKQGIVQCSDEFFMNQDYCQLCNHRNYRGATYVVLPLSYDLIADQTHIAIDNIRRRLSKVGKEMDAFHRERPVWSIIEFSAPKRCFETVEAPLDTAKALCDLLQLYPYSTRTYETMIGELIEACKCMEDLERFVKLLTPNAYKKYNAIIAKTWETCRISHKLTIDRERSSNTWSTLSMAISENYKKKYRFWDGGAFLDGHIGYPWKDKSAIPCDCFGCQPGCSYEYQCDSVTCSCSLGRSAGGDQGDAELDSKDPSYPLEQPHPSSSHNEISPESSASDGDDATSPDLPSLRPTSASMWSYGPGQSDTERTADSPEFDTESFSSDTSSDSTETSGEETTSPASPTPAPAPHTVAEPTTPDSARPSTSASNAATTRAQADADDLARRHAAEDADASDNADDDDDAPAPGPSSGHMHSALESNERVWPQCNMPAPPRFLPAPPARFLERMGGGVSLTKTKFSEGGVLLCKVEASDNNSSDEDEVDDE